MGLTWVKQQSTLQVRIFLRTEIQFPQMMQAGFQFVDSSKSWSVSLLFVESWSEQNLLKDACVWDISHLKDYLFLGEPQNK